MSDNKTPATGTLMKGKRGLVLGVATERSIAYGIAQVLAAQGAELAITYQVDQLASRVTSLAQGLGATIIQPVDVQNEANLDQLFGTIAKQWGGLDFLVHSLAFSDRKELEGAYANTTRANFLNTMDVSCYSFTDVARRSAPLMSNGGSMITLTYLGGERVLPHYNVMGVAKAALEASVRYLAADFGPRRFASMRSRRDRSKRWPPAASPTSASSCVGTRSTRRCAGISRPRRQATPRCSCSPTSAPA